MRRFLQGVAVMLALLLVCATIRVGSAEAKNYKWRLGTIIPQKSLAGQGLEMFAKKVSEKTNGQMKIHVGYNSAFGSYSDNMKAISMGAIEMMMEDIGSWEQLDKNLKICRFPYTFSNWDHYEKWISSPLFQKELDTLAQKNHHVLIPNKNAVWKRGPYRVILSKRPIFTADDLVGLKLRLYESETAKRIWRHMGCKITVIAWGEAYLALKQGMVEAITSSISQCYDMKFHEVADYITNINEFLQNNTITVDNKKWDKLPVDIQKAMTESINEVAAWSNSRLEQYVENDIQKMLDEGAFFIRTSLNSFRDKVAPLAVEFEKEGIWEKGLFEKIQKLK
ncbi:MAG: TRAP transporter substrate-binding protein [Deltaproteobacteria bacterium]|nr:TRAP transporter substrate-binding protein [Deltaproteobacteria bacterium]